MGVGDLDGKPFGGKPFLLRMSLPLFSYSSSFPFIESIKTSDNI